MIKEKKKLRNRREWLLNDLTEKERRVEWLIKREARRKSRKGMRVRVGYMKLGIDGKLWVWEETKERLRMCQRERK